MRRRGVGVGSVKRRAKQTTSYKNVGKTMAEDKMSHVNAHLTQFRQNLEDFARKHKAQINKDPEFRNQFHIMCTKIGVDPLASNKGFWSELLGVGEFYYELGVQIIEICISTRPKNGGIINLKELHRRLVHGPRKRSAQPISKEDVKTAITKLRVLGSGFGLVRAGRNTLVVSVPCELSSDHSDVLRLASEREGGAGAVTIEQITQTLSWSQSRARRAINTLLQQGMAWADRGVGSTVQYFFPSLWRQRAGAISLEQVTLEDEGGGEEEVEADEDW